MERFHSDLFGIGDKQNYFLQDKNVTITQCFYAVNDSTHHERCRAHCQNVDVDAWTMNASPCL